MRSGTRLGRLGQLACALALGGCMGAISGSSGPGGGASSSGGAGTGGPAAPPAPGGTAPGTMSSLPPGTTMTSTPACASAPLAHAGTVIRRLTRWEYVNSVGDVLGPTASAGVANLLPPDIRANGFSND